MTRSRKLTLALVVPVLLFAAIQLVPYGRQHSNPPDGALASFDSPRTQQLAQKACYDCHSNRTRWPWYASIAPMSWRIQSHVDEGRAALNFTALATGTKEGAEAAGEAGETVTKGEMPPKDYLLLHPEARLTAAEQADLARGLDLTFAAFAEGGEKGEGQRAGSAAAQVPGGRRERGEKGEAEERGEHEGGRH